MPARAPGPPRWPALSALRPGGCSSCGLEPGAGAGAPAVAPWAGVGGAGRRQARAAGAGRGRRAAGPGGAPAGRAARASRTPGTARRRAGRRAAGAGRGPGRAGAGGPPSSARGSGGAAARRGRPRPRRGLRGPGAGGRPAFGGPRWAPGRRRAALRRPRRPGSLWEARVSRCRAPQLGVGWLWALTVGVEEEEGSALRLLPVLPALLPVHLHVFVEAKPGAAGGASATGSAQARPVFSGTARLPPTFPDTAVTPGRSTCCPSPCESGACGHWDKRRTGIPGVGRGRAVFQRVWRRLRGPWWEGGLGLALDLGEGHLRIAVPGILRWESP